MVMVLFIGTEISGAKAWIKIGEFSIQPTEFMKVATALALSKFFNEGKTSNEKKYVWLLAAGMILLPVLVVMMQHDAGSALVFASFIILFYREGLSWRLLMLLLIAGILAVFTLKFNETYSVALLTLVFIVFMIRNRNQKKLARPAVITFIVSIVFVFPSI